MNIETARKRLAEIETLNAERRRSAPTHYGPVDAQRDEEAAQLRSFIESVTL